MFTGIIEQTGTLVSLEDRGGVRRLTVEAPGIAARLREGDSLGVSGVCLTALDVNPTLFHADLAQETLDKTSLGSLAYGAKVNLELPTAVGSPLGGHIVQGHVDGVGTVAAVAPDGDGVLVTFRAPAAVLRYMIEKGSVCVSGVSLTVTACDEDTFAVALIPHTRAVTTLGALAPGARVNLEADLVGKYVEKLVGAAALIPSNQPS